MDDNYNKRSLIREERHTIWDKTSLKCLKSCSKTQKLKKRNLFIKTLGALPPALSASYNCFRQLSHRTSILNDKELPKLTVQIIFRCFTLTTWFLKQLCNQMISGINGHVILQVLWWWSTVTTKVWFFLPMLLVIKYGYIFSWNSIYWTVFQIKMLLL